MEGIINKTILYYGGFILPDKNAAAQRVVANAKLFQRCGYNVVFLGVSEQPQSFSGVRKVLDFEGAYCESHPESITEWIQRIINSSSLFEIADKTNNLAGIVLYNVPFLTAKKVKKYCSKRNIFLAYDCTEWSNYTEGSAIKKLFKKVDTFAIVNLLPYVTRNIIVISGMMNSKYKDRSNCMLLPPLVDVESQIWSQNISCNTNCYTYCFVGTIGCRKESIDLLIESYQRIKTTDTRLKIVGTTREECLRYFPGVDTSDVEFLGTVSHEEAIKQMLKSDCFVFIKESNKKNNAGFPTKFVESYTSGISVITTDVSDISKYNDGNVLITQMDASEIASAMIKVRNEFGYLRDRKLRCTFDYRCYIESMQQWLLQVR